MTSILRRRVVIVPLTASALLFPATAESLSTHAKLTSRGLGRIHVGAGERRVERVLGHRIHLRDFYGDGSCATAWFGHGASGLFERGSLSRVTLRSRFYRTRSRLRVGMPESAIRDAYGSRAKRSPHEYVPDGSYYKVTRGKRRLVFETDGSRITVIHGGRIPAVDYVEGCA